MLRFSLIAGLFLLSGCENMFEKSISDICDEYPQMCSDLNKDAWCRAEKSNIIKNRFLNFKQPQDSWKYELLMNFESYKKCITKAAQIEHIKLREKKSGRIVGLIAAEKELQRLARDTAESTDPQLLYYHWSRFGSEQHLDKFLEYRDSGLLETPELQIALATFYVKNDLDKTIQSLLHALELYQEDDEVDPEIFKSLANIFIKKENFSAAYTWGYIARKFEVEELDLSQIETLVRQSGGNIDKLKDGAEGYFDNIESGVFRASN